MMIGEEVIEECQGPIAQVSSSYAPIAVASLGRNFHHQPSQPLAHFRYLVACSFPPAHPLARFPLLEQALLP